MTASQLADYRWQAMPVAPIASRSDSVAAWTGADLVVWGGGRGDDQFADGASYHPATRTWTLLPRSPLSARSGAVATWVGGYVVIWGASADPAHQLTDGARYNPATRAWQRLPAVSAAPGYTGAQLVTVGSSAVLLRIPVDDTTTTVRADTYDPRTNTWHRLPDLAGPPTHGVDQVDALGIGQTIVVWTSWSHTIQDSRYGSSTTYGIDADRLDLKGEHTWTAVKASPDQGSAAHNPQWTGDRIFLSQIEKFCGGCSGPIRSSTPAVLVDPRSGQRTTIPSLPTGTAVAVWTGGAVLDVGGGGRYATRTAAFDPVTRQWRTLRPTPTNQQFDAVTVWTGRELIRWGNGDGPAATPGAEFAPGLN